MDLEKIKLEILALYDLCIEAKEPFHKKIDICIVPDYLVKKILEVTNIDVSNHWITVDNYGICHAILHHGSPISESKRGQIAVEKEDFLILMEVILNSDKILLIGNTNKTKLPMLQFEKEIDNKVMIVKEIRTITSIKKNKLNRLVFHTMYKKIKSNKN